MIVLCNALCNAWAQVVIENITDDVGGRRLAQASANLTGTGHTVHTAAQGWRRIGFIFRTHLVLCCAGNFGGRGPGLQGPVDGHNFDSTKS